MSNTDGTDLNKSLNDGLQAQRTQDALRGGATVGGATVQLPVEQEARKQTVANTIALGNTAEQRRIEAEAAARQDAAVNSNKAQSANLDVSRGIAGSIVQKAFGSERWQAALYGIVDFFGSAIKTFTGTDLFADPDSIFARARQALNDLKGTQGPNINVSTNINAGAINKIDVDYNAGAEERRAVGHVPSPRTPTNDGVAQLERNHGTGISFMNASTGEVTPANKPTQTATPLAPRLVLPAPAPAPQ